MAVLATMKLFWLSVLVWSRTYHTHTIQKDLGPRLSVLLCLVSCKAVVLTAILVAMVLGVLFVLVSFFCTLHLYISAFGLFIAVK